MTQIERVLQTGSLRASDYHQEIQPSSADVLRDGIKPSQPSADGEPVCFDRAMKLAAGKMRLALPSLGTAETCLDLCCVIEAYVFFAASPSHSPGPNTLRSRLRTRNPRFQSDTLQYSESD